jgi:uncharacterized protein
VDEARFIEAVLCNPINRTILERLPMFGLNDVWLVSGSLFQTVWNCLTGRPPDYGIKDYDIIYFDADTSWQAEDAVIRRMAACFSDIEGCIEPATRPASTSGIRRNSASSTRRCSAPPMGLIAFLW